MPATTSISTPPSVPIRVAVLAVAGALLWFALGYVDLLGFAPLTHYSERFHVAVPLLWLVDILLFRRRHRKVNWALVAPALFWVYAGVWFLASQGARLFLGKLPHGETTWYFLHLLSIYLLYRLLCGGLGRLVMQNPAWRPHYHARRGRSLRAAVSFVALFLFLPYAYSAGNAHRVKIAPATTPRGMLQLPYEEVTFPTADGLRLSGWYIPAPKTIRAPKVAGTVLLVHGLCANKLMMLGLASMLHRRGFNTFVFDLRGHGASPGHTTSYGCYEAQDVSGAYRYLQNRPDAGPIVGLGASMGGAALLQAMPSMPGLRGAIIDSSFSDLSAVASSQMAFLPAPLRRAILGATNLCTQLEVGVPLAAMAPVRFAGRVAPHPLLVIHGKKDRLIPYQQAEALYRAAAAPRELWLVQGADHVAASHVAGRQYNRRVTAFLKRCVASDPGQRRLANR